jgi:RNA polymerase sigma factor (sigma-70 family)
VTYNEPKVVRSLWHEDLFSPSAEDEFFAEEEPPAQEHCTHDELYDALGTLTARQNFVVRLNYGIECEAMTVQQIAILMGIHHTTVSEHLHVARTKLKAILDTPPN